MTQEAIPRRSDFQIEKCPTGSGDLQGIPFDAVEMGAGFGRDQEWRDLLKAAALRVR